MGIGEAEAFSERLKRELLALEAANVHAILESEPLVDEVNLLFQWVIFMRCLWFISLSIFNKKILFLIYIYIKYKKNLSHQIRSALSHFQCPLIV